jgi:hypothetical protein
MALNLILKLAGYIGGRSRSNTGGENQFWRHFCAASASGQNFSGLNLKTI